MKKSLQSKIILLVTSYCLLVTGLCGCQNQQLYKESRIAMGTFVEVTSPVKSAAGIVFAEIKRIEDLLSKYNESSEVSRLNKLGKLTVSLETFYVIKKAKEFYEISDGAFDITVGPLLDLWGFSDKEFSVPGEAQIKNILTLIGSDKIILRHQDNVVEFRFSGMNLDLGAIAKGYALDCAVNKLKDARIKNCLVNIGGQVYALGYKFSQPWVVAIKDPRGKDTTSYLMMLLPDHSVATSGDYEQFFVKDNKRYSHILNPKTGYPADSGIVSVTVVAHSGLTADALATSIFVLGKEKGEALAKIFPGTEVKIIEKKDVQNNK